MELNSKVRNILVNTDPGQQLNNPPKRFLLKFDDQAAIHLVNFYEPETVDGEDFRWSEPVAMVRLDVPPSDYQITIETGLLRGLTFPMKLFWNDQRIPKQDINIEKGQIIFYVPRESFIRNDEQRLTISCKPLNAEKGRRQLGAPVKWVQLVQTGSSEPEFANPTKTRSRFWRRIALKSKIKKLLGMKSPSPVLPIWEMKLPDSPTSLRNVADCESEEMDSNETVIVSSVEINSRHGTGLLIQYMFEDFSNVTTVSSRRRFHNDRVRSAMHFEVPCDELPRHELYELVLNWFKNSPPKRAYIVPYYKTELVVAIALADLFGTEICLHIIDDQCLYEEEIPLSLMNEAMDRAALILLISPEMREAYQERFDHKMYILPPVVPENMLYNDQSGSDRDLPIQNMGSGIGRFIDRFRKRGPDATAPRGIIIGNIWDKKWLSKLRQTIRGSGFEVDWYSNNPDTVMLSTHGNELVDCGIHVKKPLWGQELVEELRRRPYAIMPSGMLGPDEKQESLARLSLPSRLPFVMSVSNMPIVVLGSPETAAGKFVQRFDLGAVVDYDQKQFSKAVTRIMQADVQHEIRQRAAKLSPTFSAKNLSKWIADSTGLRQPVDNRFESVFAGRIENPSLPSVTRRSNWSQEELRIMLGRLRDHGLVPQNIVDVGSGDGAWSSVASQIFPDAKFVLIEPLQPHYSRQDRKHFAQSIRECDELNVGVGDSQGRNEVSENNAFVYRQVPSDGDRIGDQWATLDAIAEEKELTGPALLKIDSRNVESLVLAGGVDFVKDCVETMILTVDLLPKHATSKSYGEFLILMDSLEFQLVDESEARRCPTTNILLAKNLVFVKREITQKQLVA